MKKYFIKYIPVDSPILIGDYAINHITKQTCYCESRDEEYIQFEGKW